MKRRLLASVLSLVMLLSLLPTVALAVNGEDEDSAEAVTLTYDDRYELNGKTVQSITGTATSYQVGTDTLDTDILREDNGYLIATGTGSATVTWSDDTQTTFTVTPAPISLVMITGHSLGAGQEGNTSDSVLCDAGQAYSTHESDSTRLLSNVADVSTYGIGCGSVNRPTGIDAMTSAGSGVRGNDSGVAYHWNELTGEKIWVLNAGVGGSNLNAWKKGASHYNHAVTLFQKAEAILDNEIKAGHYTLSHLGILNHTTANGDQTWSASEYKTAFNSMWNGFQEDLAYNFNGTTETVDCIGLLPIWNVCSMNEWYAMKAEPQAFYNNSKVRLNGKLVNYAMSALDDGDVIMASTIGRDWCAGDSAVEEYFNEKPIEKLYTKHSGGSPVSPKTLRDGVYGDGVHYNQLGYNVTGMEAAESLYRYWYSKPTASSCQLLREDGKTEVPTTLKLNAGEDYVIVPEVTPSYAKVDYEISNDDVISYQDCILYAKASGEATLTIGETTVNVTVTGTAPDPIGEKHYEWTFEDGTKDTVEDNSTGSNVIGTETGEATVTDGVLDTTNAVLKLATPVTIDPEKNWSVEVTMSAKKNADGEPASTGTLLNSTANLSAMSIWVPSSGNMCLTQLPSTGGNYRWYMVSDSDWADNFPADYDATEMHTYRLMNTNGTVSYWLDGKKIGDLTVYAEAGSGRDKKKTEGTPAYQEFSVQYIGAADSAYSTWRSNKNIQMLRIHEDGAILSFAPGFEVAAPASIRANIGETITLPQVSDEVYNHQFAGWKLGNQTYRAGDPYTVTSLDDQTFTAEWTTLDGKYLITVLEGQHMTVVPQEGSSAPVEAGGSYSFTISLDSGYEKTEDFAVMVNGTEISPDKDGVYTISNIQEQKTITVTGIVKTKTQEEIEASSVVTLYKADGTHSEAMLTANNDAGTYEFDAENHAVTMTQGRMKMSEKAQFQMDKKWVIEFTYQDNRDTHSGLPIFSDTGCIENVTGTTSIWVTTNGEIQLVWKSAGPFYWYRTQNEPEICSSLDWTEPHTYRIVNQGGEISYSIDGTDCGALCGYAEGTSRREENGNTTNFKPGAPNFDFDLQYVGAENKVTKDDWWLYGTVKSVLLCEDTAAVATVKLVQGETITEVGPKSVGEKVDLPALDCRQDETTGKHQAPTGWSDSENSYPAGTEYTVVKNGETTLTAQWADATLTKTAAKDPTCTEAGYNEYYTCDTCGKVFKDEDGTQETTVEAEKLTKLGHKYGTPEYTWSDDNTSCTAKKVCAVCKDEVTETVDTTSSVTTPATCTTKGTKTYTATFSDANGFVTQTKDVDIAATGHDWSNKNGICAVCDAKCDQVHKPGTTCSVCGKYTRRPSTANSGSAVSVPSTPNGTVTVNPSTASKGETVTITTKPSEGYELGSIEVLDKNGDSLKLKDLGNGKFSFVMPEGKVTVKAEFGEAEAFVNPYNDVKPGDWYYSAVEYVTVNGLMNGTGKGFEPNLATSRAMIWTILARMSGVDTASGGEWYAAAQQWVVANGVSDGTMPNGTITREQLAAMLYRYAVSKGMVKAPATAALSAFADAESVSSYAVEAMQWAVSVGLMNGMDGKLAPQGSATRAQVATMLMRFAELG